MNCSTTGLKIHLKGVDPRLFDLYEYLETLRSHGQRPTPEQILVARGELPIDSLSGNSASGAPELSRSHTGASSSYQVCQISTQFDPILILPVPGTVRQ